MPDRRAFIFFCGNGPGEWRPVWSRHLRPSCRARLPVRSVVERTFSATGRSGGLVPFSWVGESLQRAIAMAKRLYVGNLKYTVSSEQLQDLFEQYGAVSSATVLSDRETGRSRGFGFVEMSNDDEADAAIESLDGQDFDGRRLTVNEARPRTPGGGGGGGGGYRGGGGSRGGGGYGDEY
jgi:RNA recognition motif-containing protein